MGKTTISSLHSHPLSVASGTTAAPPTTPNGIDAARSRRISEEDREGMVTCDAITGAPPRARRGRVSRAAPGPSTLVRLLRGGAHALDHDLVALLREVRH